MKVEITPSERDKKFKAVFYDEKGKKVKTSHFGAKGMSDFTKHGNVKRKNAYLARHSPNVTDERWDLYYTPAALSRWILWNKRTFAASLADYKKRFGLN